VQVVASRRQQSVTNLIWWESRISTSSSSTVCGLLMLATLRASTSLSTAICRARWSTRWAWPTVRAGSGPPFFAPV
jgi:hypothetical protein